MTAICCYWRGVYVGLLCCWLLLGAVAGLKSSSDPFIGWEGESYQPVRPNKQGSQSNEVPGKPWAELLSWHPRVYVYHNFLTPEECDHIIRLAVPKLRQSMVRGPNHTSVIRDDYRTSYGAFLTRRVDPIVNEVDERVARWTKIPPVHAEDMQVLRYAIGQEYKKHRDTLKDSDAGPRVVTVLFYLSDVEEGGETAFPMVDEWMNPEQQKRYGPFSDCAKGKLAVRPRKGDALMFWSIHPDGKKEDLLSEHQGCPVVKGIKYTATKWVHAKPFRPALFAKPDSPDPDPGFCTDAHPKCAEWAAAGECENNKGYMLGHEGSQGKCPKSCGECRACERGDTKCYNENRRKAGYLVYEPGEIGLKEVPWIAAGRTLWQQEKETARK